MKNQIRIELTESGKSRRAEMLSDIQDSMIDFHRAKRQKRKRWFVSASICIPLISIGIWIHTTNNFESSFNGSAIGKSADENPMDRVALQSNNMARKKSEVIDGGEALPPMTPSTNENSSSQKNWPLVQNSDVNPREMELIDDDQMLRLLKQAGVNAWLAEIDNERVVLTRSGKRL